MLRLTIFLLASTLVIACGDNKIDPPSDGLPQHYSYELAISCFCPCDYVGPHYIEIKDNEMVDYELLIEDCQGIQSLQDQYKPTFTLDSLAAQVASYDNTDGADIRVKEYDPTYGYISKYYVDAIPAAADDEWGFIITKFEVK